MHHRCDIESLQVFNWNKGGDGDARWPARGLVLDTCLRRLVVQQGAAGRLRGAEHYRGENAYRYLLEVTTGLRSQVPGETNVFGQFKSATASFRRCADRDEAAGLLPILLQVERDTRVIRRKHLTGVGGASYGRLVRRLIRPAPHDRILVVGAGNLAQSLLPFFSRYRVGLWNRSRPRIEQKELRLFAADAQRVAARWATHVILTTPPDDGNDTAWRNVLADSEIRSTVHLGYRRHRHSAWTRSGRFYDLDDVFELRASLEQSTSLQLARAREACRRAAALACSTAPEPRYTHALIA